MNQDKAKQSNFIMKNKKGDISDEYVEKQTIIIITNKNDSLQTKKQINVM